jgi:hypothetical protein
MKSANRPKALQKILFGFFWNGNHFAVCNLADAGELQTALIGFCQFHSTANPTSLHRANYAKCRGGIFSIC